MQQTRRRLCARRLHGADDMRERADAIRDAVENKVRRHNAT